SPEQWLRARIHRYYLAAFLAVCTAVVVVMTFAGVQGAQINNAVTNIYNDYRQTNNNQSLPEADLQLVREAVAALKAKDTSREEAAVNKLSAPARAAYIRTATPMKENPGPGRSTQAPSTGTPPASAQAPAALAETEPNDDFFKANEIS